jgi:hypothetical protein
MWALIGRTLAPARLNEGRLLRCDVVGHTGATHDSTVGFRDQVVAFDPEIETLASIQQVPIGHLGM